MFQKIKPKKISDEVYLQIKELILSNQITPGSKLPPERELAAQLGVSRPSLREAIQKLEAQGFIVQIQGDGTYVRSITANSIDPALEEYIKRDDAIFELMELRKILETWAASEAAVRATDAELQTMRTYLDQMREARDQGMIGDRPDASFHATISYATHNLLLIHIINTISQWIARVSFEVRSRMYKDQDAHQLIYSHHDKIYQSIASRNPDAAYEAMREHLEYVEGELQKIYSMKATASAG